MKPLWSSNPERFLCKSEKEEKNGKSIEVIKKDVEYIEFKHWNRHSKTIKLPGINTISKCFTGKVHTKSA